MEDYGVIESAEFAKADFFTDEQIDIARAENVNWISLGSLCRNMGLDINGQLQSLKRKHWACTCKIHVRVGGHPTTSRRIREIR